MDDEKKTGVLPFEAVASFSRGEISSYKLRHDFDATYADILIGLNEHKLPFPEHKIEDKDHEERVKIARELLFE